MADLEGTDGQERTLHQAMPAQVGAQLVDGMPISGYSAGDEQAARARTPGQVAASAPLDGPALAA
jgi:hypothetical protein